MNQRFAQYLTIVAAACVLGILGCDESTPGPGVGTALFGAPGSWTYAEAVAWTDFDLEKVLGIVLAREDAGGGPVELDREVVSPQQSVAYEMIAYLDAEVQPALLLSMAWDGDPAGPAAGKAGLRLYNVSNAAVDVSLVRPVIGTPLAIGEASPFRPVSYGASGTNFYLTSPWWGFSHLAAVDEPATTSADVLVLTDPSPLAGDPPAYTEWYPHDIPADLDTTGAAVRVINASDTYATMDVDFPGTGDDVSDLAFASSTAWYVPSIGDGMTVTFDVAVSWNFGAGSLNTTLSDLSRGDVTTLVAYDDPSGDVVMLRLDGASDLGVGDVDLRVANVSSAASVTYGAEINPAVVSGLPHAETFPSGDGAQDLQPDEYACAVRAAGASATATPAALGDWFTVAIQDIATVVVHQDMAGDISVIEDVGSAPALTPAASGQATIRLIHAADGVADLSGYTLE